MGPEINTRRLALVLNIVPSSEITKFNGASLHQSANGCIPCNRGTVVIGRRTEVDFTNFNHSIVIIYIRKSLTNRAILGTRCLGPSPHEGDRR